MQRHTLTGASKFNKGKSVTPGPQKPPAAGWTGATAWKGLLEELLLLQLRNMSQQLILAGRDADSTLFSLEKGKGDLITVFSCLKERCKDDKKRLFRQVHRGRTRGNISKLQKEQLQLDVAKKLHRLPIAIKASPSCGTFKTQIHKTLNNLLRLGPALTRGLDQVISKGPIPIK